MSHLPARRETRWSTCTLTGEPLTEPLAADFLGSLYNRWGARCLLMFSPSVALGPPHDHPHASVQGGRAGVFAGPQRRLRRRAGGGARGVPPGSSLGLQRCTHTWTPSRAIYLWHCKALVIGAWLSSSSIGSQERCRVSLWLGKLSVVDAMHEECSRQQPQGGPPSQGAARVLSMHNPKP